MRRYDLEQAAHVEKGEGEDCSLGVEERMGSFVLDPGARQSRPFPLMIDF